MATIAELERAMLAADAAGDTTAARHIADNIARMHQMTAGPATSGQAPAGAPLPGSDIDPSIRSAMNVAQGPTLGFADELYGLGVGAVSAATGGEFGPGYERGRDVYRGAVQSFREQYPQAAMVGGVSGGLLLGKPVGAAARALGAGPVTTAATLGGSLGGVQGAGEAPTIGAVPGGAALGTIIGAAGGAVMQAAGGAAGAVAGNIAARMRPQSASELARRRIAEALNRDDMIPGRVGARLNAFGDEAVIADVSGENTRLLLDTLANIPGRTRQSAADVIRNRIISRGGRMSEAAAQSMAPGGQRFASTIDELETIQRTQAGPIYDRVQSMSVPMDAELSGILSRAERAFGSAREAAEVSGRSFTLNRTSGWTPLRQLDELKKTLWDVERAKMDQTTGKHTQVSLAYNQLRRQLIDKLDRATTGADGSSLYQQARNAFAGPAEMKEAAQLGYKALNQKAWNLRDQMEGMSQSELDAFRVGAFEALREKAGTMGGQSQLMNMYREPATREKLQELFPSESAFRRFASSMEKERVMRRLESATGGSPTAARLQGADDLNASVAGDIMAGGANIKAGNVGGAMKNALQLWSRVSTPEPVRNEIGRILLSGRSGHMTAADLFRINQLMREMGRHGSRGGATATGQNALATGLNLNALNP